MTFGVISEVPAPVEVYDAVHAEVLRRAAGTTVSGLLVHVARPTADGFQVLEVWESREQFERVQAEIVGPAVAAVAGSRQGPEPVTAEFEVRGLLLPQSGVLV